MKETTKKVIRTAVFIALASAVIAGSYRVLSWKDTMGSYVSSAQQLYATKKDLIDVLFVGSSHCYAGVNPDMLWRDHGIAAFDMAISGQDRDSAIHYIKEALKTQSPSVVVVDLLATLYDEGVESNTWRNVLSMRTSPNQIDLARAEAQDDDRARKDYVLKWPIVHTRYRELAAHDFVQNPYSLYGRGYCYRFAAEPYLHDVQLDEITEAEPVSDANLRWFAELDALAEKEGFSLVYLQIPHEVVPEEKRIYNGVLAYLTDAGQTLLTADELIGMAQLNTATDYMDQGHLNAAGGEKLTGVLGAWLIEHYAPADHRGDPAYHQWDESLAYAEHLYLEDKLSKIDGPAAWFSGIAGVDDLVVVLVLSGDYGASEFDLPKAVSQIGVREAFFENGGCVVIDDGALAGFLTPAKAEDLTLDIDALHTLHIEPATDSELSYSVNMDGQEQFNAFDGLGVVIYDRVLERIIANRAF
ncbi:MAG: hypothetical protein K6G16_04450 [Lachnospiraceae bacterium]|nr:hypothetical protein [Lachnospiraceae bacterium]